MLQFNHLAAVRWPQNGKCQLSSTLYKKKQITYKRANVSDELHDNVGHETQWSPQLSSVNSKRCIFREEIMTAVLLDDVVNTEPTLRLTLAPPNQASRRPHRAPVAAGDPMVDAAARLLSIPLRHVYAVLWRVGALEVRGAAPGMR